jgi:alkylhydroperoxidase family enzyme
MMALLLMGVGLLPVAVIAASPRDLKPTVALLANDECWRVLPAAEKGEGQPLPSWARALAAPLPRTTAALLNVDFVQRARSPLDPKLRARMRWVAAHANRCDYSEAYALFDARRAGLDETAIEALRRGDASHATPAEKVALEFARKMTVAPASVTDDEFAALVKLHGEKDVVAMVLLTAYANFQDRLVLCLGSPLEPGGPLVPLDVTFAPGALAPKMLAFPKSKSTLAEPTGKDLIDDDREWTGVSYDELQERLERQRSRSTRLRVPSWEEVLRVMPEGFTAHSRPVRIVWTLVCMGYQPELAAAWETLMRTAGAESRGKLDRVFSQGLFWVTTKSVECPYCMGHCEMNWEVAGLTKPEIAERSRLLSGDDWSSFPAEEQRAYAFSRKLARAPWTISSEDIQSLKRDFGLERTVNILVYVCRGHYMTRVSNGFQLSLERDNVFFDYYAQDPAPAGPTSNGLAK